MRWGAAHPRAASLSAAAFPWARGSSELVWAGIGAPKSSIKI